MRGVTLKHTAKVQRINKTREEFDTTPTWETTRTIRCRLQAISEREGVTAQQQVADETHEVVTRYTPAITSDQRLVILGNVYSIASVVEIERARWLRLGVVRRNETECC